MSHAPLIIVSGPSGVGKTTVVDHVVAESGLQLHRGITATTRLPRSGEVACRDYYFWSPDEFRLAIEQGQMLEWANVHGQDYYGTPRSEVDPYRQQGVGVILVIDVQGAQKIRSLYGSDQVSIFFEPPDFDELRRRLQVRGESEPSIVRRLATAADELTRVNEFDFRIKNDDLQHTVNVLDSIVRNQFSLKGSKQCSTI